MTFGSGDSIFIIGDSLTASPYYRWAHYFLASVMLRFPALNLKPMAYGSGGLRVQHFLLDDNHTEARFAKYVAPLQPQKVITFLGTNGGDPPDAYTPTFSDGYADYISQNLTGNGITGTNALCMGPWPQTTDTGSVAIGARSEVIAGLANGLGMHGMDVWDILYDVWTDPANRTALRYPGTQLGPETHAGTAGQIILCKAVLEYLGVSGAVSAATVNGAAYSLTSQTGCTVTGVAANAYSGVDFTQTVDALPWIFDPDGWDNAVAVMPSVATWQTQMLTVTGLAAGVYDVYAGGEYLRAATSAELAAGINIAPIQTGPHYRQRVEVLRRMRLKQGLDPVTLVAKSPLAGIQKWLGVATVGWTSGATAAYVAGTRTGTLVADLVNSVAAMDALDADMHAAAAPVPVTYSFRLQGAVPVVPGSRTRGFRRGGVIF